MRTDITFIWANDHENRATLLEYDPIPNNMPIPRVGETVFLNDAKNNKDHDDNEKYSYDPMIVAEVEWSMGKDYYSVGIVLRDPNPEEWAEGAFKFYPEYDYDHKGGYTVSGTFTSHRPIVYEKEEPEETITLEPVSPESLGVTEIHSA